MAMEIFKLIGSVFVDTDKAEKSLQNTDKKASGFGQTLMKGIGTAAKWAAGIATAAGAAATALSVSAVNSYADYEQLVGGIETMFKDLSGDVEQYAKKAYQTAGLSANQYMETVLGFSAALTASLKESEGNIERAAELADQTVIDMADNAAKFGTDMASIQNAYSGFAKQNYTMLDNLKLGYGGTKKEMERLLADAQKLTGVEYNIDNLADVYEAIHAIQEEMGITGTVAKEGTDTISGGIGLIKGQLENFKTTIGEAISPVVKDLLTRVINALPSIQGRVDKLAPALAGIATKAVDAIPVIIQWVQGLIQKGKDLLAWAKDIGAYVADALSPIFDDLAAAFSWLKEKLEPVITAIKEFFTSGQAAETITNAIKAAADGLAAGYEWLKDFIASIVQGFQDMVSWGQQHEDLLITIGIAIGTLTAAIIAYNAAQAIKQAGGVAELVQLGILQVQLWGLSAAQAAQTAATWLATTASTAFGAVMSFITSPITLVVLAIGALIAIVVLLVKNWDTVKEFALKCWEGIKNAWNAVADWFYTKVVQPIANFFSDLWSDIKSIFSSVGSWFSNIWTGAVNGVKNAWSGIKNWFSSILSGVKSVFSSVATAIGNIFKSPINFIIRGINSFIRGLNKIKIPDWVPAIGGKGFHINTIPELEKGGVLERGQVGLLEGNGAEAVVPLEKNKKWISAVAQDMDTAMGGAANGQVAAILTDILRVLEDMASGGNGLDMATMIRALVSILAKPMDKKLGQLQAAKARV